MRKRLLAVGLAGVLVLGGCSQASRVSHNISKDADNFRVDRRLAVINTVTGEPMMEMIGKISIKADTEDNQLEVTALNPDGTHSKHFVGLSPTTAYIIEDVTGSNVSTSRYQISYLPEAIVPVYFKDGNDD